MRPYSFSDQCIALFDTVMQTVFPANVAQPSRSNPSAALDEGQLNASQKQHAAGLMRVNHSGEVSAQALYQGQAFVARDTKIREHLLQAAAEEIDHLAWCEQRLSELESTPSVFNPLWYSASFFIGTIAGLAGDKISLGFLAETEEQVTRHLQQHLHQLPDNDHKSRAIVKQMAIDENNHALAAYAHGGVALPKLVRTVMRWGSKLLTTSSYYI
jgi:ubiquinone biosynthesis monooxygenase Coq7